MYIPYYLSSERQRCWSDYTDAPLLFSYGISLVFAWPGPVKERTSIKPTNTLIWYEPQHDKTNKMAQGFSRCGSVVVCSGFNVTFNNFSAIVTTVSGCDRELNAYFYSADSLKYHARDPWHDTTPSHIILTRSRPLLALPCKSPIPWGGHYRLSSVVGCRSPVNARAFVTMTLPTGTAEGGVRCFDRPCSAGDKSRCPSKSGCRGSDFLWHARSEHYDQTAQAVTSLRWAHTWFCWFCHAATHMFEENRPNITTLP